MTPIERVARALCEVEGRDPDEMFGNDGAEYPFWHLRRDATRAVLTAIREPSEAMDDAGSRAGDLIYEPGCNATEAWQAMIDAALGE